ncbi:MAG: DNA mismatch repair endonuclease MutL, partial [Chloroflexi bacterium]|nr:DNA mismatch repair endonuclease MutL [Chloroflexota bacterium]
SARSTPQMTIRVLPPDVSARIAAGEVVERPAAVVKELIENSIDAGASRITIETVGGGIELIRVTDDGSGIDAAELPTAFERHATSKLIDEAGLVTVPTLGFRGEALPSIAAVAEVEMTSRVRGEDSAASIRFTHGAPPKTSTAGAPEGTVVTVHEIFGQLPARRKFLRSPASENNAITAVVTHHALAYLHVRFTLTLDGRQTVQTSGSGDLRDAAAAIHGSEIAAAMIEVQPVEGKTTAVHGLIAPPQISRSNRKYISLFMNGRWIQSRRLAFAVEEAYSGMLMTGRHPIAILHLRVPPEEVDINVHPTKAEVRFRDESAVFSAVQRSVHQALTDNAPVPTAMPLGNEPLAGQPTMPPLWQHAVNLETQPSAPTPSETASSATVAVQTPAATLPVLRVIGQFGGTYVIAEGPEGMFLIDQHAAHERVLYERFWSLRQQKMPEVQGLLEPMTLQISAQHRALLGQQADALKEHGFELEEFGEGTVLVRALPPSLAGPDAGQAVISLLDTMLEEGEGDRRDRVAMSLACHGAIRAGKTLTMDEMRELIHQLEETATPNTCPHGRPTMVHMSADVLAREFGRR